MNTTAKEPAAARLLVVDDEPDLRTLYELTLLREGYHVVTAGTLTEARALVAEQAFDLVITDMRLPDGLGLELLRELSQAQRSERCIVITAYGSAENAVEALKCGAFDYLTKPVDLKQFRAVVASALQTSIESAAPPTPTKAGADANTAQPTQATGAPAPPAPTKPIRGEATLDRMIGDSAAMRAVKQRIRKVAPSMAPVLIHGESGTGKELVAQAVHGCSHRSDGPFVPVNCGAIPENLLEAEFFGARKGSYTGATQDRDGFFQAARGGTLFLDEIGDLPLAMQAKLLRAIQERRVRALGDTQEEPVDVRIVSATHRDLAAEVQAGRFRQDLFYRLNVIEIVVPPLRERREDLPALCHALLGRIAADAGIPTPVPSERLLQELQEAPLEGNVRELENLLHRAMALGEVTDSDWATLDDGAPRAPATSRGGGAGSAHAPPAAPQQAASPDAATRQLPTDLPSDLGAWLDEQERQVLVRALDQTGFNRTAAAALLGLNLRQIRYRMARLGITEASGDDAEDETD